MKKVNFKSGKNRGITLIALVITIIVMLILVTVTISIVANGGLFDYAGNATKDTEIAMKSEQDWATLRDNMPTDDIIAKYTGGWYETEDGNLTNGEIILQIGDYVNYSCYNGTEYAESGFTVNQDSNTNIKWRVLSAEKGNLLLVSESSLGNLELDGAEGYFNGENLLNTICAIYGHGLNAERARSINVEDINKITGFDPMTATDTEEGKKPFRYGEVSQYKNGPVTYELNDRIITYRYGDNQIGTRDTSNMTINGNPVGLINIGETESSKTITINESTYYVYSFQIGDEVKKNMLAKVGEQYWLASSYVMTRDLY